MTQTFAQWFEQQATRQDAIGELARKYPKVRSWDKLTDAIEDSWTGCILSDMQRYELAEAYQAREEYDKRGD